MDVLVQRIKDVNFHDQYDRQAHRKIYNVISIVDPASCPPLYVLVYAVENIINPDLIRSQIPSLLDLLAQIELIRQRAVKAARDALAWNQYYTTSAQKSDGILLLSEKEREIIECIVDERRATAARTIYIGVIFKLCELHIHSLWKHSEGDQLGHYIREYFPSFTNDKSSRMFQLDLSEDDQRRLQEIGKGCFAFLDKASKWETELEEAWVMKGYVYGIPLHLIY
ncbi:hypothetical protein NEOLEDRAFT_1069400 [Neolentinus lepideus HHB14362 ss-1]|uniref:Uncharacterized protein n=1 Tax=Neolentinus lepideus HHB14362 ss-1 TaxID=1314782 RepID=A0A165RBH4_9AGAM|nr:hypothetical protein NEOLEDRAFT_1069400 [Neolentinus lepideus HHB14362 ss-1]